MSKDLNALQTALQVCQSKKKNTFYADDSFFNLHTDLNRLNRYWLKSILNYKSA